MHQHAELHNVVAAGLCSCQIPWLRPAKLRLEPHRNAGIRKPRLYLEKPKLLPIWKRSASAFIANYAHHHQQRQTAPLEPERSAESSTAIYACHALERPGSMAAFIVFRAGLLASPPLVIAYAIAAPCADIEGRARDRPSNRQRALCDIWRAAEEIDAVITKA